MPLFNRELNEVADHIGRADFTIYLHTAAPSDGAPTNGRITIGGGVYETGATLTAAQITAAASGHIENNVAIPFGTVDEAAGTVRHCSAYRGNDPVGFWTLPATVLGVGDTFTINANSLDFMGSTS